jgi:hypothetical protein
MWENAGKMRLQAVGPSDQSLLYSADILGKAQINGGPVRHISRLVSGS